MHGNVEIVNIRRGNRRLVVRLTGARDRKRFYGSIDGALYVIGQSKGEVLRYLLDASGKPRGRIARLGKSR